MPDPSCRRVCISFKQFYDVLRSAITLSVSELASVLVPLVKDLCTRHRSCNDLLLLLLWWSFFHLHAVPWIYRDGRSTLGTPYIHTYFRCDCKDSVAALIATPSCKVRTMHLVCFVFVIHWTFILIITIGIYLISVTLYSLPLLGLSGILYKPMPLCIFVGEYSSIPLLC